MEVFLWGALLFGATAGLGYLANRLLLDRVKRRWKSIARELGLTFREPWRISGAHGRLFLRASRSGAASVAEISVRGKSWLSVTLKPRPFSIAPPSPPEWSPDFDQRFIVEGDPEHALALFGAELRQALVDTFARRWTLDMDALGDPRGWRLETSLSLEFSSLLKPLLQDILTVGRHIDEASRPVSGGEANGLAQAFVARLGDPHPVVRARAAKALTRYAHANPEVSGALERALGDPAPEVRFHAAIAMRRADILVQVARDELAQASVRSDAFARAVNLAPQASDTVAMVRAWSLGADAKRRVQAIQVLPEVTNDVEEYALETLRRLEEDSEDEEALIALLAVLAKWGTARSVPHLTPYRDRFFDSALRVKATDAIRAIQARIGSSRGDLALAPEAGWLSEPE